MDDKTAKEEMSMFLHICLRVWNVRKVNSMLFYENISGKFEIRINLTNWSNDEIIMRFVSIADLFILFRYNITRRKHFENNEFFEN